MLFNIRSSSALADVVEMPALCNSLISPRWHKNRYVGNLPPMPGVFPDYPAPVVRNAGADASSP
jgi:hypothetical protein